MDGWMLNCVCLHLHNYNNFSVCVRLYIFIWFVFGLNFKLSKQFLSINKYLH